MTIEICADCTKATECANRSPFIESCEDHQQGQESWWADGLLIYVQQSHDCYNCDYRILKGSKALKKMGGFYHYPKCPESRAQNKKLVELNK